MLQLDASRPRVTPAPVGAINQRVPEPFERLFLQEYPKVVAIAYRVLADRPAAEDVAQEVFIKFHRSYSPTSERASGWLHSAAVHSALNVIRSERRRDSCWAIQPANATAAWPDGRPPRSGVPRPVYAFVAITAITVRTSATSVSSAGASRSRSSSVEERSATLPAKTR